MTNFLYNLLMMSVSGTIMFLLATLLYKQTKSKYARWYYALLITSILLFILPLQEVFSIPKAVTVDMPQSIAVYTDSGFTADTAAGFDISYIIFAVWALGALTLIAFNVYSYLRTRRTLLEISRITLDVRVLSACTAARGSMGIKSEIQVRKSDTLRSPLLFGIINPVIILPDVHFSDSELKMIFTHELTHYRHKDLIVKLTAILVSAIHWFNPCVYILKNAINNGCELCCDETVLSVLNLQDKKQYGRLLLSVIENDRGGFAYTTAMSAKQSLKQRLTKIVEFKRMSLPVKTVSVMLALSMTVCSVTVFGFDVAKDTLPDSISGAIDKAREKKPSADASGAYMNESSQIAETPVPSPEEITPPEESADISAEFVQENDAVENDYQPDANAEEASEETPVYDYQTPVYTKAPVIKAEEPEETEWENSGQEIESGGYYADNTPVVRLPESTYMFNPKFSADETTKIRSGLIIVNEDCYMRISASGSDDLHYSLYKGNGELHLTDAQMRNAKIPVKAGEAYYIIAECNTPEDANIYIYAK